MEGKFFKEQMPALLKTAVTSSAVLHGDCLDLMKDIETGSIDMILADLPYGTTACKWDTVINLENLWLEYNRIIKGNGAIILFCQQPFTSALISSNYKMFKYLWYWRKSRPSGFVNAKLKPLKDIEEIAVFSKGTTANKSLKNMPYYPQDLVEVNKKWKRPKTYESGNGVNPTRKSNKLERVIQFEGYPRQVLDYNKHNGNQLHETEKPVELIEYLIKTYSKENQIILDNTAGSGTTGIACINTNRNYILMEKEKKYFDVINERIKNLNALGD